jgi:MoaA/NifB/PqqE/SkfB family radical SAM enzyme
MTDVEKLQQRIINEAENTFPQDIAVETTGFCNLKCAMCSNDKMKRKKGNMSWRLFIKIVEEIAVMQSEKTRLWLCFYGEPLMSRGGGCDIADRVWFAKAKGVKNVVMNSNMNLMTPEVAKDLVLNGLNSIFVGLDAATEDVYAQIRSGGNFEKVVGNVLDYKAALDKYGKPNQQIVIQFIDMPLNHHQREDVAEFWHRHGIEVKVRPFVTWQDSNGLELKKESLRLPCHWLMNVLPITSDGCAVWCGCDYDGNGICGNLNEDTIKNLWKVKKEHRLLHLEGRWSELPDFCRNCGDWQGALATYE